MSLNPDIAFAKSLNKLSNSADQASSSVPATVQNQPSHASLAGTLTYSRNGSEVARTFEPLTTAVVKAISHNQFNDANAHSTAGKVACTIGQVFLLLGAFLISLVIIDPIRYLLFKKGVANGSLNQTVQKVLDRLSPENNIVKASAQRIEAAALQYRTDVTKPGANADGAKIKLQEAVNREVARLMPFLVKDGSIVPRLCEEIRRRLNGQNLVLEAGNLSEDNSRPLASVVIDGDVYLGGVVSGFRGIKDQYEELTQLNSKIESPFGSADLADQDFLLFPSFGSLHDSYARQFPHGPLSIHSESEILDLGSAAAIASNSEDPFLDLGRINLTESNSGSANPIAKTSKAEKQAQFDANTTTMVQLHDNAEAVKQAEIDSLVDTVLEARSQDKERIRKLLDIQNGSFTLSTLLNQSLEKQKKLISQLRSILSDIRDDLALERILEIFSNSGPLYSSVSLNRRLEAIQQDQGIDQENTEKQKLLKIYNEIKLLAKEIDSLYDQDLILREKYEQLFTSISQTNTGDAVDEIRTIIVQRGREEELETLERETSNLFTRVLAQHADLDSLKEMNDQFFDHNNQDLHALLRKRSANSKQNEALAARKADALIFDALPTAEDEDLLDEDVDAWLNPSVDVAGTVAPQESIDDLLAAARPDGQDEAEFAKLFAGIDEDNSSKLTHPVLDRPKPRAVRKPPRSKSFADRNEINSENELP